MNEQDRLNQFFEEYNRAQTEAEADRRRSSVDVAVGSEDKIFYTFKVYRGYVKGLIEFHPDSCDISPDQCFVLLEDDCVALPNELVICKIVHVFDEFTAISQAALDNWGPEFQEDFLRDASYKLIMNIWKNKKITWNKAIDRITKMVVKPRPEGQKYNWNDVWSC